MYHSDYRKLKHMYRFIQEIMEGKLVVSKKKRDVVAEELRERNYEAFPRGQEKKAKSTDEDLDKEESEEGDAEASKEESTTRDYDYLLSVWPHISFDVMDGITDCFIDAHLVIRCRAARGAEEADRRQEGRA